MRRIYRVPGLLVVAMGCSASFAAAAATGLPDKVYWGDEHVHSGWSGDAGLAGTTLPPEQAVRFARGEEVRSSTGAMARLQRPLDWMALTDHSDGMGTINLVREQNPELMADPTVKRWGATMDGGGQQAADAAREVINAQATRSLPKVFMNPKWMMSAWQKNVDIMEKYNEPGKFTAFIAYEWTSNGTDGNNLHRNVIFRDGADKTRDTPPLTTFVSADPKVPGIDPESLWAWLAAWESKTGGKVLAIPHNGNLSNGQMFEDKRYNGEPLTRQWVEQRARWEPLFEVYQIKGTSETHPLLSPNDEYANFGIWDTANLNGVQKEKADLKGEYLRTALTAGLRLQQQFGSNPFKYGMVAGSDTHNGLATGGEEDNFWGKFVADQPGPKRWDHVMFTDKAGYRRLGWTQVGAGVTGVWATANTREALWDAMQRRETYASSGPRISVRFFAGYDFSNQDAEPASLVASGYARGVPMGGDLQAAPAGKAPTFLFAALKDPQGANLDAAQIIKGWVDAKGESHERIFNVAWSEQGTRKEVDGRLPPVGNTVDLATATYQNSIGATELVGSFTDPQFDPAQRAYYYLRAVEIPTPRWTAYDSVRYKVQMTPDVPMTEQERVVTSPIWYNPG
jgi:hypothetical protein